MPTRAFAASRRLLTSMRLRAQGIAHRSAATPAEAVGRLLAMQAQDLPGTLWAIGLRTTDATQASVTAAFADGRLVRSWPMRGTLHVVEPHELGWMLDLTAARSVQRMAGVMRQRGVEEAHVRAAADVADRVLGGEGLTRPQFFAAMADAGIPVDGQRGIMLVQRLALDQRVVIGPSRDRQPVYGLFAERVPAPRRLDRGEALAEWARRFLTAHGPATVADLAWWSSLTLTDARAGVAAVAAEFERLEVDGVEYLVDPAVAEAGLEHVDAPEVQRMRLLPGFDEYLLGYRDRSAPLHAPHADRIVPGGNGVFLPTIVDAGEVVGGWTRTPRAGGRVELAAVPFGAFGVRARRAFARAAAEYGAFLETEVTVADAR